MTQTRHLLLEGVVNTHRHIQYRGAYVSCVCIASTHCSATVPSDGVTPRQARHSRDAGRLLDVQWVVRSARATALLVEEIDAAKEEGEQRQAVGDEDGQQQRA